MIGCIPLALLPKADGGQEMTPSTIPNLYKDSWGNLCNSLGMAAAPYDCPVCFDATLIKISPQEIGRASEGAWHALLVPCPKYDREARACRP